MAFEVVDMELTPSDLAGRSLSGPEIEYTMLREETLKRMEQRQQVLSITMTLAAGFLGIGWGSGTGAAALLLFVPLAALLAAGWTQNELRIRQVNTYIRDHLESRIPGLGYERYSRQAEQASRLGHWPVDVLAIGGIFLLTQVMAVVLSVFRFRGEIVEWLLLALAAGGILLTLVMVEYVRRRAMA